MTNESNKYKSLLNFADENSSLIRELSTIATNSMSDYQWSEATRTISSIIGSSIDFSGITPALKARTDSIGHTAVDAVAMSASSAVEQLSKLHMETLLQLNQLGQTEMIRSLTDSIMTAEYSSAVDTINQALRNSVIKGPDVAFLKTSTFAKLIEDQIVYPYGLETVFKELNKTAAEAIADNDDIELNTEKKRFVNKSGNEIDSKGLNVISSGKYIIDETSDELFAEAELIDFNVLLSTTPMLALESETGRRIKQWLLDLFENGSKTIDFDKEQYFHCRARKKDEMPYTFEEMLKAPHGITGTGRYNHAGRSHYYLSDTREGADAEVKKHKRKDDVLQTVIVRPVKSIKLLDLSGTLYRGKTFLKYIRFGLGDASGNVPREYLIPCFVSDCCKAIGFDGIKYYGSKEYSNYVVWNDGYFEYAGMCKTENNEEK